MTDRKLTQKVVDLITETFTRDEIDSLDIGISVMNLQEIHGDKALKGFLGCAKWGKENGDPLDVNNLRQVIAHDLPRPGKLKKDITPMAYSYAEFYSDK